MFQRSPTQKGDLAEQAVIYRLMLADMNVYKSVGASRTDLVYETATGEMRRVQVKTGRFANGTIYVNAYSVNYRSRTRPDSKNSVKTYVGEVEDLGVFVPTLDRVLIVPMEVVGDRQELSLRVTPPRGKSRYPLLWAKDYEI